MVITPRPASGRMFTAERRVRLGDVSPDRRVRFDALARYLQDVSRDDSADAAYPDLMGGVVRRTVIEATRLPRFQEWLRISTWCSGFGGHWAERSTEIRGTRGGSVDAASLWVHVDERSGRPRRLPQRFHEVWGESAAGRRVSARLMLPAEPPCSSVRMPWSIRASDLDSFNHMNNAAHWAALVEVATHVNTLAVSDADTAVGRTGQRLRAELEHLAPVEAHQHPVLWAAPSPDGAAAWLTTDGSTATAALLSHPGVEDSGIH